MMKKFLPLLAIVFLLVSTPAFASNIKNQDKHDENKIEVKVNSSSNRSESDDDKHDDRELKLKIEQSNSEFEIRGEISSIYGNSFVIGGQTIQIDPSKVEKLKLKGILEVGNTAKVEGVVVEGSKYAEEIKLIGTGQGRFKLEVSGVTTNASPTPNVSPTPNGSPSASPEVSPSPAASPEVSATVKIKAVGPVDKVVHFLQQVLGFLGNIGGSTPEPSSSPSPSLSPSPTPDVSPSPVVSPSPTVSPSPSPEVSPSPTPEVSPSPSVSPTPSPTTAHINIKLGLTPVENIIGVIGALINALQNLV